MPRKLKTRVQVIHWKPGEIASQVEMLRDAGYDVVCEAPVPGNLRKQLRDQPPAAIIIDLSRLPSHGREVSLALRSGRATRAIPLVFAEGDPEKVARLRALLPDAVYTTWRKMCRDLQRAIARPPANPVKPAPVMAGYSGTPLPKKLGIKEGSRVVLAGAPPEFEDQLDPLPENVQISKRPVAGATLLLWFVRSRAELVRNLPDMADSVENGSMWIIWPKKASGRVSDLSESLIRESGLAAGLVDFKVCAVDETYSGLWFRRRKAAKS